jgi:hypothetical protein
VIFSATVKAVPFLPLEGIYPAWVDTFDSALDHPRKPAFMGNLSATPTGAVAVVTAAYDAIDGLPSAIARYLSLGYAPGTGFDRNQQAEAIAELKGQLAHFRDTYPARIKEDAARSFSFARPDGLSWNETVEVEAATRALLGTYPSKTGSHPGVWSEIGTGTAIVAVTTVALVAAGPAGAAPALAGVIATGQRVQHSTQAGDTQRPTPPVARRIPVAVDPVEEILPFALVGLALAIGI